MKFKTTIKMVFFTVAMSLSPLTPAHSINSFSSVQHTICHQYSQPQPPFQGDGGSRFAQPVTPCQSSLNPVADSIE
ncbi:MAG: hypothetical protein SWJ54_20215 [Cyanobacteriota bacterium]|nr:hypothetical protein [Cyanobacteriota bacterium]